MKDPHYMPILPLWLADLLPATMKYAQAGAWHITEYCASAALSLAFIFFTLGRFSGSAYSAVLPPRTGCWASMPYATSCS